MWRTWDLMGFTPKPVHIGKSVFWKYKELEEWITAGCPKREIWHYRERKPK
jgi:predicted DNA-binding transcriptional regulator AlpA